MIKTAILTCVWALLVPISFALGVVHERDVWQASTMGDLCQKSHYWACELHPDCGMNALLCCPLVDVEQLERQ